MAKVNMFFRKTKRLLSVLLYLSIILVSVLSIMHYEFFCDKEIFIILVILLLLFEVYNLFLRTKKNN